MNEFEKLNRETLIKELETLNVVLDSLKKDPTPQRIQATAKLVEALRTNVFEH